MDSLDELLEAFQRKRVLNDGEVILVAARGQIDKVEEVRVPVVW